MARKKSLPVLSAYHQQPSAPTEPSTGPAMPEIASCHADFGCSFIVTNAPRKGMNIGALAGMPIARSAITWPISWTNSNAMKPSPNFHPQIHAYAASDTATLAPNVNALNLMMIAPHLATATPVAAIGAKMRLRSEVGAASGP